MTAEIADDLFGSLTIDPMRIRQVLLNLLSNSCKFTKAGEVKLKARRIVEGRDWIELSVADTGIGMTSSSRRSCSRSSARPTPRPPSGSAAPGWASPSPPSSPA